MTAYGEFLMAAVTRHQRQMPVNRVSPPHPTLDLNRSREANRGMADNLEVDHSQIPCRIGGA